MDSVAKVLFVLVLLFVAVVLLMAVSAESQRQTHCDPQCQSECIEAGYDEGEYSPDGCVCSTVQTETIGQ